MKCIAETEGQLDRLFGVCQVSTERNNESLFLEEAASNYLHAAFSFPHSHAHTLLLSLELSHALKTGTYRYTGTLHLCVFNQSHQSVLLFEEQPTFGTPTSGRLGRR